MKAWFQKLLAAMLILAILLKPTPARTDFWGGDLPLLAQIVVNTMQQLVKLNSIIGTGRDSLNFMRDINSGIREAMRLVKTMNTTLDPGVLGQIQNADQLLRVIQDFYGKIPKTPDGKMQQLNDQSVAEAITLHNQAFQYATMVDAEAERIKEYARDVSPVGAAKLTAQSLGVLIHVLNQVLRTNAAILKIMGEDLALQNRHEKVNSEQFRMQYDGLSSAFLSQPSFKAATQLKSN